MVYHHGSQASGGHYTVAVRCGYRSQKWIELDDTNIYPLTPQDVAVSLKPNMPRWGQGTSREAEEGKDAYLLLYAQV